MFTTGTLKHGSSEIQKKFKEINLNCLTLTLISGKYLLKERILSVSRNTGMTEMPKSRNAPVLPK